MTGDGFVPCLMSHLLIGQSGIVVLFDIDRTAVDESETLQQVLHHDIIAVGVDAQVAALLIRPVQAEAPHSLCGTV